MKFPLRVIILFFSIKIFRTSELDTFVKKITGNKIINFTNEAHFLPDF